MGEVIITGKECTGEDELFGDFFLCPNCDCGNKPEDGNYGCIAKGFKYCPNCGAKIKWELGEKKNHD